MSDKDFKIPTSRSKFYYGLKKNVSNIVPGEYYFYKIDPTATRPIRGDQVNVLQWINQRLNQANRNTPEISIMNNQIENFWDRNERRVITPNDETNRQIIGNIDDSSNLIVFDSVIKLEREIMEARNSLRDYGRRVRISHFRNFGDPVFRGYNPTDRFAAIYLISEDKKILVHRRALGLTQSHTISVPGGGVDRGETTKDAALRELKEETGIILTNEKDVRFLYKTGATDIYYAKIRKDFTGNSEKLNSTSQLFRSYNSELADWPRSLNNYSEDLPNMDSHGDNKNKWMSYEQICSLSYGTTNVTNLAGEIMPRAHSSLFVKDGTERIRPNLSIEILKVAGLLSI